jgi:hypothetical protein
LLTDRLPALDTSRVVTLPGDTFKLFRTDISLRFKPHVTDSAKAAFFDRHSMHVLGVTSSGKFFVRIPDPGPLASALFRVVDDLGKAPEVALAVTIPRSSLRESLSSPEDESDLMHG